MTILITGGTGTLGRHVLPLLLSAGHDLRVLTRRAPEPRPGVEYVPGDLLTGDGVAAAAEGADIVMHLAGAGKGDDVAARHLVRAASRARHLVYISVIGADRVPLAWFRSKLDAERAVTGSGVPWTTLRAAQFHELTLTVVERMAKLPVVPVPRGLRLEPVDSGEVAARLVELALGAPSGLVADLPGPQVHDFGSLTRAYLRARGGRRPRLPVPLPGTVGRAYRAGANLARPGAVPGTRTWEDFLARRNHQDLASG